MTKKNVKKAHLLIVEARFYEEISDALLKGATETLEQANADFDVVTVPGALEIPAAIAFAEKGEKKYDGYVALGCVIRGETYHFEIVSNESCRGIADLSVRKRLAIGNGIITVENEKQAWARALPDKKNKGGFAAEAALHMIALKDKFGANR
ncbi:MULTISPECIES: 6,7-dimethyl-8-ribityllumazine synthase [Bartonella]|uniref:6,7-dimethyl-8-ribityllumazine synthase n=1 Tax=Bartonella choladocola TaxID=2750995 RepID=A0A1U9MGV3_9HYPH|nr:MULTISPECIES: 6,7-dimethyl-8-ribityllumazine synthase [Bartonella]AQT47155.1 6,7-dimethyl-8-ribityllumazine synthase [Bartonella choladocola]MBH9975324.1 6,7-dimethyl-8-ribityllumazine synthase [Bartonella choladocola]MBI0014931.1 6,7-dimethyl-8-ribityllumazine synthase [Bartonella sp. B10834G3]MBI0140506.1 6,7-dimethyl-8-ribityllumazine synthase [Bartonella choladocola]